MCRTVSLCTVPKSKRDFKCKAWEVRYLRKRNKNIHFLLFYQLQFVVKFNKNCHKPTQFKVLNDIYPNDTTYFYFKSQQMEKYAKEIVTNSRLCIHQKRTLFSETVVIKPTHAHCLKIAKNVAFLFGLVTLFDRKLQIYKR